MAKNEFKTVNFTLAENVQLEMVEIPGYPGELENVPAEKWRRFGRSSCWGNIPSRRSSSRL